MRAGRRHPRRDHRRRGRVGDRPPQPGHAPHRQPAAAPGARLRRGARPTGYIDRGHGARRAGAVRRRRARARQGRPRHPRRPVPAVRRRPGRPVHAGHQRRRADRDGRGRVRAVPHPAGAARAHAARPRRAPAAWDHLGLAPAPPSARPASWRLVAIAAALGWLHRSAGNASGDGAVRSAVRWPDARVPRSAHREVAVEEGGRPRRADAAAPSFQNIAASWLSKAWPAGSVLTREHARRPVDRGLDGADLVARDVRGRRRRSGRAPGTSTLSSWSSIAGDARSRSS